MEDSRMKKILYIVIMILVVIIILLCLTKCEKKDDKYQDLTGNSDVFNINIKCDDSNCKIDCQDDKSDNEHKENTISNNNNNNNNKESNVNSEKKSSSNNKDVPTYNETTDVNVLDKIFVDDNSGNYIYQQRLNIFNNAAFNYTNKIAPGVSNTYNFKANNTSNESVKYYLEMYEESEYNINLKYRLKKNGSYIIGDDDTWVDVDDLKTSFKVLNGNSYDEYSLDWKWFDDDSNDTIAGENMTSEYKLNIRFYFETAD